MKKNILVLLVLAISGLPLFADYTYYQPLPNCFSVDLDGSYNGAGDGIWRNPSDGKYKLGYGDEHMVGLLGVTPSEDTTSGGSLAPGVTYEIDFTYVDLSGSGASKPWMYTSASDPSLQIPFGLDLVVKHNDDSQEIYHVGYQDDSASPKSFETISISTPENANEKWQAIWVDIVLKIPAGLKESMAKAGTIRYAAADDYRASFLVQIKKSGSKSEDYRVFSVYMTGYYGSLYDTSQMSLVFSVNPFPAARTLNLTGLIEGTIPNQLEIGSYFYTTSALRGNQGEPVYDDLGYTSPFELFVSSSSNPTSEGSSFALTHVDYPSLTIPFDIGLKSDYSSKTIWYDGTAHMDQGDSKPYKYDSSNDSSPTTGRAVFESSRPGDRTSLTFDDDGAVYFRLSDSLSDEDKGNLLGGYYSANVYFHLISNC